MRIEQALSVLPDVDALQPLRSLLLSTARADHSDAWSGSARNMILGKREVALPVVRSRISSLLQNVAAHLATLYEAMVQVLARCQEGDRAGAVGVLLDAGETEVAVGRVTQARQWFQVALELAAELPERVAEIDALCRVGQVCLDLGDSHQAARSFQRAFVLAEGEGSVQDLGHACDGLGRALMRMGQWDGAEVWFNRALDGCDVGTQPILQATLLLRLAEVSMCRRHLEEAEGLLDQACVVFEEADDASGMTDTLLTRGRLARLQERREDGANALREGLAWVRGADETAAREIALRCELALMLQDDQRLLEAEDHLRRAEALAISAGLIRHLIDVYLLLGELRARERDDAGFVFFEQAIELCRAMAHSPAVEAKVYRAYAQYWTHLGALENARHYREQARVLINGDKDEALERQRAS